MLCNAVVSECLVSQWKRVGALPEAQPVLAVDRISLT